MSIALMTAVWKLDLAPSDKMVLLALADAANDQGVTWMAVRHRNADDVRLDLLTKCSLSERAVQGALKRLCEGGLLSRKDVPGKGVIWTVTPAADAPPQEMRPAGNDVNPRSKCGETVSNHHTPSGANAPSGGPRKRVLPSPSKRCPESWSPTEGDLGVVRAEGFTASGDLERALAKFRDITFRTARSDWSATFRNFIREQAERRTRYDRPDHRTAKSDHLSAVARAMAAACDGAEGEYRPDRPDPRPAGPMLVGFAEPGGHLRGVG